MAPFFASFPLELCDISYWGPSPFGRYPRPSYLGIEAGDCSESPWQIGIALGWFSHPTRRVRFSNWTLRNLQNERWPSRHLKCDS